MPSTSRFFKGLVVTKDSRTYSPIRNALRAIFSPHTIGAYVEQATMLQMALDRLAQETFDLLVLDLALDSRGSAALYELLEESIGADKLPPLIFLGDPDTEQPPKELLTLFARGQARLHSKNHLGNEEFFASVRDLIGIPTMGASIAVLIIDDDLDDLEVLHTQVNNSLEGLVQFSIDTERSFEAGLARAEQQHYDLAIVDWMLGQGVGADILARLRQRNPFAELILISGRPRAATESILSAGTIFGLKVLDKSDLDNERLQQEIELFATQRSAQFSKWA